MPCSPGSSSLLCDGYSDCDNNEDEQCSTDIENGESFCQHNVTGDKKRGFWCESGGKQTCTVSPRFNRHVVESEIRRNLKKIFSSINDTLLTPGEVTTPVVNHGR